MQMAAIETPSLYLIEVYLIQLLTPGSDADRLMDEICRVDPLAIGAYDRNVFETASGVEHYRPCEGAAAGAEAETRHRPDVVQLQFQIKRDPEHLKRVIEHIFQVHIYQEPTIEIREGLASRSKGLDDRANPHRWWNREGDWLKKA
jgi:hypothetical protein